MTRVEVFLSEVRPLLGGRNHWELDLLTSEGQSLGRVWREDSGYRIAVYAADPIAWTDVDCMGILTTLFGAASSLMARSTAFGDLDLFLEGAALCLKTAGQIEVGAEIDAISNQFNQGWIAAIETVASDTNWEGNDSLVRRAMSSTTSKDGFQEQHHGAASSFMLVAKAMKTLSPQSRDWDSVVKEFEVRLAEG